MPIFKPAINPIDEQTVLLENIILDKVEKWNIIYDKVVAKHGPRIKIFVNKESVGYVESVKDPYENMSLIEYYNNAKIVFNVLDKHDSILKAVGFSLFANAELFAAYEAPNAAPYKIEVERLAKVYCHYVMKIKHLKPDDIQDIINKKRNGVLNQNVKYKPF